LLVQGLVDDGCAETSIAAMTPERRRRVIARRLVAEISHELFAKGVTSLAALVEHEHQEVV